MSEPVFESAMKRVLGECLSIAEERGGQYADTWALENQVSTFTDAVLREIGVGSLTPESKRLLLLAALVDIKDSRMIGGWRDDTVADGVNYRVVLLDLMRQYAAKRRAIQK